MLGNDTSMNNLLKQIFLNHTEKMSDKWTLYINEWDRIFTPYRDLPINLFEIGIQNGGSLEIWAKYFTNAKSIIGCDIDEKCRELLSSHRILCWRCQHKRDSGKSIGIRSKI
jgi:hypothetical protein